MYVQTHIVYSSLICSIFVKRHDLKLYLFFPRFDFLRRNVQKRKVLHDIPDPFDLDYNRPKRFGCDLSFCHGTI